MSRYVVILVLYSLASFGGVLAIAEGAFCLLQNRTIRLVESFRPSQGVHAHLMLRLLPPVIAIILTALSALPGYVNGEPPGTRETPGPWLVGLAVLGLYAIVNPAVRTALRAIQTTLKTRDWSRNVVSSEVFCSFPVVELELDGPLMVASGFFRRQIFLSSHVRSLLAERELRAALRHEVAHCRQHHNLAKLVSSMTPHIFPAVDMEESLRELMEYAADDEACLLPGDALNLASAVVTLARQWGVLLPAILHSALVESSRKAKLQRRIERLMRPRERRNGRIFSQLAVSSLGVVAVTAFVGCLPIAQHAFREILEMLVR